MSKSLPVLVLEMNEVVAQIVESGGELSPVLEEAFTAIGEQVQGKADSYGFFIERLEAETDFWKEKAEAYLRVSKSCKALKERLHESIKAAMIAMDMPEIEGQEVRFKLTRSAPKLVIDETTLPQNWKMQVTEWVVDKPKIKAAIEIGTEIPGVKQEDVYALRKSIASKKGK